MDIGKLPMRVPAQSVALTLVLLRNDQDKTFRLWYGEGEAVQQESTNSWDALKSHTKRRGHWQVWFWRRVFSAVELNNFVIQLETDHAIKTDHYSIPVELRERSLVLLPVGYHESLLSPVADQSAWLWELWDQEKKVQKLGSEEWGRWVNAATKEALGIDLGYWPDRIGNLAIFFPTGVVTDWNYDSVSQSAVIRTNLPSSELADHEIELEAWGGDEIVACERVQPRGTLVVFRDIPSPSRATIRVYQHGFLLHHDMAANVIKAIGLTIHVPEMVQNGRVYTRQAGGVNWRNDQPATLPGWARFEDLLRDRSKNGAAALQSEWFQ